jgi:predicted DCC family thiol-disulfide oxidoreductase YuxK
VAFSELGATGLLAELTNAQVRASAHFVTENGIEFHGGESVTQAMRLLPGGWLAGVLDLPGLSFLRDAVYRLVAMNRHRISRLMGMDACGIDSSPGGASNRSS